MSKTPPARSTFVTILAWSSIAMSAAGTAVSLLQNVMVQMVFPQAGLDQALQAAPDTVPTAFVFVARHAGLLFFGALVVNAAALACSIGLLRRRSWARRGFIGLMALGIAWQLGGLVVMSGVLGWMREQFALAAEMGGPDMGAMVGVFAIFGVLLAISMTFLNAWIILRLLSPRVAAEFG